MLKNKKWNFFLLLIFVTGITLSCKAFNTPQERLIVDKYFNYQIDPNTIINDINNGDEWVFKPIPNDYEVMVSVRRVWTQDDYFKVIDTFAEKRLPNTFTRYHLDHVSVKYNCEKAGKFPRRFSASYNKENDKDDNKQRERFLFIIRLEAGACYC